MGRPFTVLLLLVSLGISGCVGRPPVAGPPASRFSCAGPPRAEPPAPQVYPPFRYEASQLTVRRGSDTVDVVARGVPLGAVVAEAAVGESVFVHPDIVFAPVAIQATAVSFDTLLVRLAHQLDLEVQVDGGHRALEPRQRVEARRRRALLAQTEISPLETRLVPVPVNLALPLAETYCRQMATARGSASVLGPHLVVQDTAEALSRVDELVRASSPAPH